MLFMQKLLILSCSQRKNPALDLLPAIKRYTGPQFLVLAKFLRENPNQADDCLVALAN